MRKLIAILDIGAALTFTAVVQAQIQVTEQATASAINYAGAWNVGTEQTQQFPLVYFGASKAQVFSLGAREILNPGVFDVYGALGNYQPDLTALLKKTTINPDEVQLSFDVLGGVATVNGVTGTKPALEGRVNFQVAITPNTSFTGGYAGGGLIGGNRFGVISAGLSYLFGNASASPSALKKSFVKRYMAAHYQKQID